MENNTTTTATASVRGPKALFWYLTLFFSLAITATSTGAMWFQYINKLFPKEISGMVYHAFSQGAVKYAIASLLIAAPLFMIFTMVVRRALTKSELSVENRVRTWITYVILFIAIAVAVGDLIAAVLGVLNGDFTPRFLLKVGTILDITIWVFVYYWLELRSPNALANSKIPKIFGIITAVVVAGTFIGGFFIVDSPAVTRNKAYDQTKVSNLYEIKYSLDNYYVEFEKLPETLADLQKHNINVRLVDPQTDQPYEYRVVDELSYELCAEFNLSSQDNLNQEPYAYSPEGFVYTQGKNCFTKKVMELDNTKPLPVR